MPHITKRTEKRFKLLSLFAMQLGIWEDKMQELAEALDTGHEKALKALDYYEDALIAVMEADKPENVTMPTSNNHK